MLRSFINVVLTAATVCVPLLSAQQATADTRFEREVAPLLARHCLECHNNSIAEGGLDLTTKVRAFRGGEQGTAIIAGNAADSLLWQRVVANEMPPEDRLSDSDKQLISQWIDNGARWTGGPIDRFQFSTDKRAGYDWWSLQPLGKVSLPPQNQWALNQIDRFISAKLRERDLQPASRADPRTLVRRAYADLLGLPAPYDVVEQFRRDPSQPAWERLVDELLESPHYGERWAQHWLDVARFGESHGYEYNAPREHAWHYRDWVIRALNDDLPYDQFVRMQIAGDILAPQSTDGAAAVGFLVAGPHNTVLGVSEAMKQAARHEELAEIVGTTAQAFLGLTVNCARCHDHKFDPISTAEYYQLIATLDGVTHGNRNIGVVDGPNADQLRQRQADLLTSLSNSVAGRGLRLSSSANAIQTANLLPANEQGVEYTVSLTVSPTVWADRSQATTSADRLLVQLQLADGQVVSKRWCQPPSWSESKQRQHFVPVRFQYRGDGRGDVRIRISSNSATGRFGGAIDDLRLTDDSGRVLFEEDFDSFDQQTNKGVQADTGLPVYWGLQSARWQRFGINSLHAVAYESGNFAAQIFSGWQDNKIPAPTADEQAVFEELREIKQKLTVRPMFTVVPRQPGVMRILLRGDVSNAGPSVAPAGLKSIAALSPDLNLGEDASDAERRQKLAQWITHHDNGPFHRVIVNRVWHHHFGRGIVDTPNDLGFNGSRPSHPDLLDWLATWLRDSGYSLKQLHRLIMTSATYQQSSRVASHPSAAMATRVDRDNRLLWRQNARRVDAEMVRDALLSWLGPLETNPIGPGYRDVAVERVGSAFYYRAGDVKDEATTRRSIYRWRVRGERNSLLETFDCPDPSSTTPRRNVTTTATQLLSHWNNSLVHRVAESLATRLEVDQPTIDRRVDAAWRQILARQPNEDERELAVELVERHGLAQLCRVLFNCNEAVVID